MSIISSTGAVPGEGTEDAQSESKASSPQQRKWWEGTSYDVQDEIMSNQLNEGVCYVCRERGALLLCSGPCFHSFHRACVDASAKDFVVPEDDPSGEDWFCGECTRLQAPKLLRREKERELMLMGVMGVDDRDESARSRRLSLGNLRLMESLQLGAPLAYDVPAEGAVEAARRGISYVFRLASEPDNFMEFGTDVLLTFNSVAHVAREPVREFAFERLEVLAQRWKQRYQKLGDLKRTSHVDPSHVADAAMGMYVLERLGISHPLKLETRKFVQGSMYTAADYFGGVAYREPAGAGAGAGPSRTRALAMDLPVAYCADHIRLDLGASLTSILGHVHAQHPYSLADEMEYEEWADQTSLAIAVILALSNYGKLRLVAELVPEESRLILHPSSLQAAMRERDVQLVGGIGHCMRILGVDVQSGGRAWMQLHAAIQLLLALQELDGSWKARGGVHVGAYSKFHVTMSAVKCLHTPIFRGFGPADMRILDALGSKTAPAADDADGTPWDNSRLCACGILVDAQLKGFAVLRSYYKDSSQGQGADLTLGVQERARERLRALVEWKHRPKDTERSTMAGAGQPARQRSASCRFGRLSRRPARKSAVQLSAEALRDRGDFEAKLREYWSGRGEPAGSLRPLCGDVPCDLYSLYHRVASSGGFRALSDLKAWTLAARQMQLPSSMHDRAWRLREL
jgi:hypothetical protein